MSNTRIGWLVNDCLTCIPNTKTFWHNLLEWFPNLIDKTNGYTDYLILADIIEKEMQKSKPSYIIRNGSYFRKIYTDVYTISLIQDILSGTYLEKQIEVINSSDTVVFNTEYVYNKYKKYINNNVKISIIPLGIDFTFFKPIEEKHPDVLENSIIYIGSSLNYPKGFNVLLDIIKNTKYNFCLVMKDDFKFDHSRIRVFNKVNSETVRLLINSCILGICTSYEETQHLSGIECIACNKPMVSREVGVYYDNRNDSSWGCIADDSNFIEKIDYVINNLSNFNPRNSFINKYTTDICRENWSKITYF